MKALFSWKIILFACLAVTVVVGILVWSSGTGKLPDDKDDPPTSEGPQEEKPSAEAEGESVTPSWVSDMAQLYVLERLAENNPEDLETLGSPEDPFREFESVETGDSYTWDTNIDYFIDSGIMEKSGDGYRVDTSVPPREAGLGMPDESQDGLRQTLINTMSASEISWCDLGSMSGYQFTRTYLDEFHGSYDTHTEYRESIENYVACEEG